MENNMQEHKNKDKRQSLLLIHTKNKPSRNILIVMSRFVGNPPTSLLASHCVTKN